MAGQVIVGEVTLDNIKAAKAGALENVEALVAEYTLMVFRIAYSVLRNHHDAEDAVQECFLRVLKYGKDLQQVRNPKTWLARIAWTAALESRSDHPCARGADRRRPRPRLGGGTLSFSGGPHRRRFFLRRWSSPQRAALARPTARADPGGAPGLRLNGCALRQHQR